MSYNYWELLWRRARRFLTRAERDLLDGDYDGASFNAEQAVQLGVKATIYRIFGLSPLMRWVRIVWGLSGLWCIYKPLDA
jgi:HEPN domain-containing protein